MSSVIRCSQLVGHWTTIHRQSVNLNKCCRLLNVNHIVGHDKYKIQRDYSQSNWEKNQQRFPFGLSVFEIISIGCASIALYNWKRFYGNVTPVVNADAGTGPNESTVDEDSDDEGLANDQQVKQKQKREKVGFRDRKIIEYENRIRHFSTPDKVFRYFATVNMKHDTWDEATRWSWSRSIQEIRSKASRRHFEIAFRLFDLNGDGDVDCEEFEKVATLVQKQTSIGSRHRDHANTGNTFKGVNSALTTYFFGKQMNKKLTIEKFLEFQQQIQREILSLEFKRKNPNEEGNISESDFAELLLAYAGLSEKKKSKKMKRVKKRFRDHGTGVCLKEYLDFFHFLNNINDVDTALTFYHIAGASIDQAILKHVAKTVAHVELSDHVVDVVFTIFDENMDNQLSNREFVSVMKNRLQRGLEKQKDTGFVKLIHSMLKCAKDTKPVLLDI